MSSEELARKLQRRLRLEALAENNHGAPQPAPYAAPAGDQEPEPPARAPMASADSELSAQLNRRLDIHQGAARSRRSKVFNPYTEFPEFSRRLLKDLESMFKMYDAGRDGFIDLMELKLMMEKLGAPQTHLGLKSMIREVDEDFDGKLSFREVLISQALESSPLNHWAISPASSRLFHSEATTGDPTESKLRGHLLVSFWCGHFSQRWTSKVWRAPEQFCQLSAPFLLIFHKAAAGELQEDSGLLALAKLSEIDVALEGVRGAKNFFEAKAQALSCSSRFEAELKAEQDERKREEETRRLRQAAFQELKAAFST
nr:EF-hand domain-containing protein D1 isoform X2 [Peromyscus maniculatus bairdii]